MKGAWLNGAGTFLAVAGDAVSTRESRAKSVASVLEKRKVNVKELEGDALDAALRDFRARKGWYRGEDVNQLSAKEAGIFAERLAAALQKEAALNNETRQKLAAAFTDIFKRCLIPSGNPKKRLSQSERKEQLTNVVREQMGERGVSALEKALPSIVRAQPEKPKP